MIGKSVSHYQILEKLGAGGMGVVWKARDTRLNRIVALKMLLPASSGSSERRQRFLHEAQAASALNHPHIVTVHDIVTHDGADVIVMEHIPGKTLDALIPRKGMRVGEALRIAVQVADALTAAHRAGIIHRDLKPGNVMVSDTGAVKVLDFGLAKAEEQNPRGEDVLTRTIAPRTMDGIAVGTVGYMSPEQAAARPVDARSDIFSFGALLYEMVTGERAFTGDTNIAILPAALHKDPAMPSTIPAELQRVIARCLRKDPQRRFQHMDDLTIALEELRDESQSSTPAVSAAVLAAGRSSRNRIAIGAVATVIVAAAIWWLTRGAVTETAVAATEVPLTSDLGIQHSPSFSPDGNQVVFSWNGEKQDNYDIYVKLIGSPSPLRLTSDPATDTAPAFSPDGRAIAFIREGKDRNLLIAVPPIGGPERVVAELPPSVHQLSYLPDGKAVIVSGLAMVSIDSGEIKSLNTSREKTGELMPAVAPNGRAVAFALGSSASAEIYVAHLDGTGNLTGTPHRLTTAAEAVRGIAWTADSAALVVDSGPAVAPSELWRIGVFPAGPPAALPFGSGGRRSDPSAVDGSTVAIARTGNRLVYSRGVQNVNLWQLPLAAPATPAGMPAKFLPSTRLEINPAFSPDGKRVVFHSTRSGKPGLWVGDASSANAAELFVPQRGHAGSPDWSPDGQTVVFDWNETGQWQIYSIRAAGGKPNRLTNDQASDTIPSWSGDGKWIYFTSDRSGRPEVWKIAASGGAATQVTRNGGMLPKESPDGRFVYYMKSGGNGGIWRTPLNGQWHESQIVPSIYRRHFALSGRGIYFISPAGHDGKHTLCYMPFEGGKPKPILTLPRVPAMGLAVSPGGGSLLYSQIEQISQELALVENFK